MPYCALPRVHRCCTRLSPFSSAKTLALFANGGEQSAARPHTATLWKSTDDGDSWTDETTEEIVTNGAGIAQWYENTLYMNSGGQGIFAKALE